MSATLPPKQVLCQTLGIKENDMDYFCLPSAFPVKNRPIYIKRAGDMTQKHIHEDFPKMAEAIKKIIDDNPGKKGVIHAHSWKMTDRIMDLKHPRMISHNRHDKMEMLEKFEQSDDLVLVSPSSTRGVSLDEDKCRFIILVKAPFPDLGNKLVSSRFYSSGFGRTWYIAMTIQDIIQGSGRGVRSKKDYCSTYILDSAAIRIIIDNKRLIPDYWWEAVDVA
jgi:Rad3-related DNA helicase